MSIEKNTPPVRAGQMLRSTSLMSLGTLVSRILGFVRDVIFARFFGTAAGADAFVVAFRLPNLFRDIMGEGAANSSFVPVMTEYKEKKPQEVAAFLNSIFAWAVMILCAITLFGILCAPWVVRLVAPGFADEPGKVGLTVHLTQIMFPYLIFIGLTALFSAIQFTYGSFAMPAFGPCLLNIVLIVTTLGAVYWMKEPVMGLAWGVILGGVLQCYFQWLPLKKHGVRFAWTSVLMHPGAKQVGRLILPRIFGSAVYQLNIFVDTICASLVWIVGPGGIAAIYYANRVVQFPMGIFGVALASAILPALSSRAVAEDNEGFKATVVFGLKNILFLLLPMVVFLVVLAEPLVRVVFQRGKFDAYSTSVTAAALVFFALGLLGYGVVKILVSAFHARQDTKTPVKVAVIALVVNAACNVAFMFPLKVAGIALASAVASVVNVVVLWVLLEKKIGGFGAQFRGFFSKLGLAGILQILLVFGLWQWLGGISEIVRLPMVILAGAVVYFAACYALGIEQARQVNKIFNK
ncbi:MAG: murein biosynthesis integral membrane protein MurJ [Candidatus Omnitrophica bacterium]|nr:murein biosynthesis integral membrane protein MurJ [Candidatus Omnitrophota bacterium]